MEERMYGVVLWTDKRQDNAVIWCEDHGNLAFYSSAEQSAHRGTPLDAGDLIQFDLREESEIRRARNPERVNANYAPDLVSKLKPAGQPLTEGNVIAFPG
ncbi:hypothetical protein [Thalassococcus lentus]|uniref:Uncharacterized protein n=1 Tax=Thalassococcus lentus TaxID=1210524 RepID=A0ABT4XQK6_9RHOB|nr:hypothetical protein [Thalassococcus lentus]MDA7424187.1 hypothetical protein [Thalassococcus lentus]